METKNVKLIKGNHEFFYECWVNQLLSEREWWNFGGKTTIMELKNKTVDEILKYYNYIHHLPIYHEFDDYVLSHNGFNANFPFIKDENGIINITETIDAQYKHHSYNFIISSDIHFMPKLKLNKKMIVGHYPTLRLNGPNIFNSKNCIDIDCGATYSGGRLACLCLDTMQEYYVHIEENDVD